VLSGGTLTETLQKVRTCFVAAPGGIRLDTLRESLLARKIRPLIPEELFEGSDWASEIQRQILEADLVIGILPRGKQSPWVLFELGQAWALGRQILLLASPKSDTVPYSLQRVLVLRTEPDNREAIDFALDQLLAAPQETPRPESKKVFLSHNLGGDVSDLVSRLNRTLATRNAREFETVIADAIRNSGVDMVVNAPASDTGADIAVWSDVLEPYVGNPLVIETKMRIPDRDVVDAAARQLRSYMAASGTRWSLLVFGEGPGVEDKLWRNLPPNILVIPARTLIESLRTQAFPEIIRDLRNRRVHAVRP
jgi:hypothetical protein